MKCKSPKLSIPVKYVNETQGLANQIAPRTQAIFFLSPARLYPYGAKVGDAQMSRSNAYSSLCLRINIPGQGLPFFIREHNRVYVSTLLIC